MADSTGTTIAASTRTEFGKGAARRIRREHRIPAVLYGHGQEPRHLALPGHATMLALKTPNALLSLQLDGGGTELAVVKAAQVDPVRREIEHVDLVIVRRGERIEVSVPVRTTGEASSEAVVNVELGTVTVTASATDLPEAIEVDVEGMEPGTQVTAADLRLPAGTELAVDPEAVVVVATAAPSAAALEAELAEAEAEAGIVHDAPDAEAEDGATAAGDDAPAAGTGAE